MEFGSEASEPPHPALSPLGEGDHGQHPCRFFVDICLCRGYCIILAP